MYNEINEHELYEDDSNGEQILWDESEFEGHGDDMVDIDEDYYADDSDDGYALASAGWGTDEDYNGYCYDDY